MKPDEHDTRSLAFLTCILCGLVLMIPSMLLFNWGLDRLASSDIMPAPWLRNVLGLTAAFLPMVFMVSYAARRLSTRYPHSVDRRIPEPHERPSAHKRSRI